MTPQEHAALNLKDKTEMVAMWGGWAHRRWEVLHDQEDERELALMARDLGLRQSRRLVHNAFEATALRPGPHDRRVRYGYLNHPAELALRQLGLMDHPRLFVVPGRRGMKPGVILLQPYMGAVRRSDRPGVEWTASWADTLRPYRLELRVVVHPPYNESTVGIVLFSADDHVLLHQLEGSEGYLLPVLRIVP